MNMRRWIVLLVCLMCLVGCANKDEFTLLVEGMSKQTFETESRYVDLMLELKEIGEDVYRYRLVINQPKANLDNVKAFVVCDESAESTIPSIGFYDNDKCNLYISKIDLENNYYEGISLMGLTTENSVVCSIYLSYEVNGEIYEEYIVMEESCHDAS